MSDIKRFWIRWVSGQYKVSIPNLDDVEVVDAESFDKLQAENEALKARAAELESAMRSVNRSEHHAITVSGDDEPRYWQRKKWVDWIFFLGNGGSDEVRGD